MKDIRIATILSHSPVGEIDENLDRMKKWIQEAGKRNVHLICFPELNITGYSTQTDMGLHASPVKGKISETLLNLAVKKQIVILAGMVEIGRNKKCFASHFVFNSNGDIGVYRKLHIAPPEKEVFISGDQIPVFETDNIKFGIQLCYDAHFPELSTHMALSGVDIIFIPHASPRGTPERKFNSWMRHLPARAYDNSVFVVALNQTGNNGTGLYFPGVAIVIGPSGKVLDKKLCREESMMVTDLKGEDIQRVRDNRMHFFLPNRRTDLFPVFP